jgi:hypothetical protein
VFIFAELLSSSREQTSEDESDGRGRHRHAERIGSDASAEFHVEPRHLATHVADPVFDAILEVDDFR